MENQTKHELERALMLKLLSDHQNRGELEWVEARPAVAEANRLTCNLSIQTIDTCADAVAFLAERCDLIAVQLEIVPPLWKVVSLDGAFEALFSDTELIGFARQQRPDPLQFNAADAKTILQEIDVEIIETDGGIILHGVSLDGQEFELTCDSEGDLVELVRFMCSIYSIGEVAAAATPSAEFANAGGVA